jgi:hypothetical protein
MMNVGEVDHDAVTEPFPVVHLESDGNIGEYLIANGDAVRFLRSHHDVIVRRFDARDTILTVRNGVAYTRRIGTRLVPIRDEGIKTLERSMTRRVYGVASAIGHEHVLESDECGMDFVASMARAF